MCECCWGAACLPRRLAGLELGLFLGRVGAYGESVGVVPGRLGNICLAVVSLIYKLSHEKYILAIGDVGMSEVLVATSIYM